MAKAERLDSHLGWNSAISVFLPTNHPIDSCQLIAAS